MEILILVFDTRAGPVHNTSMKKVILILSVLSVFVVAACGVRSDLARPDPSYPRNYPMY